MLGSSPYLPPYSSSTEKRDADAELRRRTAPLTPSSPSSRSPRASESFPARSATSPRSKPSLSSPSSSQPSTRSTSSKKLPNSTSSPLRAVRTRRSASRSPTRPRRFFPPSSPPSWPLSVRPLSAWSRACSDSLWTVTTSTRSFVPSPDWRS